MTRGRWPDRVKDLHALAWLVIGLIMIAGSLARFAHWTRQHVVGDAIRDSLAVHVQVYHSQQPQQGKGTP
jgi:hypothetical protein